MIRFGTAGVQPLLEVRDVTQEFAVRGPGLLSGGVVRAVSGVSFDLRAGETLAIVGESGSGKSTLARSVLQIPPPKSGSVRFRGVDLTRLRGRRLVTERRQMQMIFQDPFRSLDPKWRVMEIVEEPLIACRWGSRAERRRRVEEVLERVGLSRGSHGGSRPGELSGGQCQRVAIARALAVNPALIICDEAVSSLDVLIQAQVLNLFQELQNDYGLSYLFISHDLAVVKRISDQVGVLHRGELCELGSTEALFEHPAHPYTAVLIASMRTLSPEPPARRRFVPAADLEFRSAPDSSGCQFRAGCPRAQPQCARERPSLREIGEHHWAACHFPAVGSGASAEGADAGWDGECSDGYAARVGQ